MKTQKHTLESLVIFILSRQKSITPNAHLCVATIGADFVYANSPQYFHEINSKIHTQLQRSRIFTTHSRVSILNIIWYSFTFGHKMPICIFEIEKVSLCDYNGAYVCVRRNRQRREDEMNVSTKQMRLEIPRHQQRGNDCDFPWIHDNFATRNWASIPWDSPMFIQV